MRIQETRQPARGVFQLILAPVLGLFISALGCTGSMPADEPADPAMIEVRWFNVASADHEIADRMQQVLDDNGIPNARHGSVAYAVTVPEKHVDSALRLLKMSFDNDALKSKHLIQFWNPPKPMGVSSEP